MTIKQWNIPSDWQEPFVAKLTERGASGTVVNTALEAIDDKCKAAGEEPLALFGEPRAYAESVILPDTKAASRSRTKAIALALLGLLGMFLTLWGWAAMQKDTDKLIGMSPVVIFVIGALLCLGAAIADALLGAKADVVHGAPQKGSALLLNKLGPWIIVALTLVGMLLIWVRNN